jgi:hypothetical protein
VNSAPTSAGAVYKSNARLGPEKTDALVVMCSDRRYRAASEEFISLGLGLRNYDVFGVPGGVYMLSFADALPKQLKVGMRLLKFVLENHTPPRVVLIAHEGCSRYRDGFASFMRRPGFTIEGKQRHDLNQVATELRETFSWVKVEAYFARETDDESVEFEVA